MRREGRGEGPSRAERAAIEDRGDRGSRSGEKASPRGVASLGHTTVRCLEGGSAKIPKERVWDPPERILEDREWGWRAAGAWERRGEGSQSAGRGGWVAVAQRGGGFDGMPCHWRKVVGG
jgi:hypothetical protein